MATGAEFPDEGASATCRILRLGSAHTCRKHNEKQKDFHHINFSRMARRKGYKKGMQTIQSNPDTRVLTRMSDKQMSKTKIAARASEVRFKRVAVSTSTNAVETVKERVKPATAIPYLSLHTTDALRATPFAHSGQKIAAKQPSGADPI